MRPPRGLLRPAFVRLRRPEDRALNSPFSPVCGSGEIFKERDLKQLGPAVSDSEVRAHWPLSSSRYTDGLDNVCDEGYVTT
jgi:hypothetical protein